MGKIFDTFIGSYGSEDEETIHWLRFNSKAGDIEKVYSVSGIENPSFVIVNNAKTHLYAVSERDEGEVVSYKIDYEAERLIELNRQPTKGGPCFVEIDEYDRFLFTANYGGGSIIVHPLKEGQIGEYTDFIEYDSMRFTSNAHSIKNIPGTNVFVVADLGHDEMKVYKHRAGKLHLIRDFLVADNAGPRHIAFKPELNMMYVLGQDDSSIFVYNYDDKCEQFDLVQIIATVLEPFSGTNYAADIHVAGSYLYASNRGHHSITGYEIKEDGRLDAMGSIPSGGEWPRNFGITPDDKWLIAANEHTDNLVLMKVHENGLLEHIGLEFEVSRPVCVEFVER